MSGLDNQSVVIQGIEKLAINFGDKTQKERGRFINSMVCGSLLPIDHIEHAILLAFYAPLIIIPLHKCSSSLHQEKFTLICAMQFTR